MVAVITVIVSQVLIFTVWKDAKFGTIANAIVLIGATLSWGSIKFESQFPKDVEVNLERTNIVITDLVTEADIQLLQQSVQ